MGDDYDTETRAVDMLAMAICHHVREEECELTMRQIAILLHVRHDANGIGSVGQALRISDAAVSRAVDVLQRHQLVRRARVGQRVTVGITPRGIAMVGRLLPGMTEAVEMA